MYGGFTNEEQRANVFCYEMLFAVLALVAAFFQRSSDKQSCNTKDSLISSIQSQLDNFDELTDDDIHTICCTLQCLHDSNRKDAKNESRNVKPQC